MIIKFTPDDEGESFSILNGSSTNGTAACRGLHHPEQPGLSVSSTDRQPMEQYAGPHVGSTRKDFQYPQRIVNQWNIAISIVTLSSVSLSVSSTDRQPMERTAFLSTRCTWLYFQYPQRIVNQWNYDHNVLASGHYPLSVSSTDRQPMERFSLS